MRTATVVIWAALIPLLLLTTGCVEEPVDSASEDAALQQEVERVDESSGEEIQEIDDERSVERRIRDATVAAKVRTALVEARELRSFDFEPVVVNGRVLLRGEVNTQTQRRLAENVAEQVDGVRGVVNEISAIDEPTVADADDAARDSVIAMMEDAAKPETSAASRDTAAESAPAPPTKETASDDTADNAVYHTVRSGESLWTIARSNGVSIDQIRQLNGLGASNNLQPGQRLRVK